MFVCVSCEINNYKTYGSTCSVSTNYQALDDLSRERIDTLVIDDNNRFIFEVIEWNSGKLSFVSAKLVSKVGVETQVSDLTNHFYSELSGEHFPDGADASEKLVSKIFSGAFISRRKYERLVSSRSCEELIRQFL